MTEQNRCPECGADNDLDVRRCRVCANLLNVGAEEVQPESLGEAMALPENPLAEPLSAAEIDRLAKESVRAERMSRRPKLFRKVFDHGEEPD